MHLCNLQNILTAQLNISSSLRPNPLSSSQHISCHLLTCSLCSYDATFISSSLSLPKPFRVSRTILVKTRLSIISLCHSNANWVGMGWTILNLRVIKTEAWWSSLSIQILKRKGGEKKDRALDVVVRTAWQYPMWEAFQILTAPLPSSPFLPCLGKQRTMVIQG